ncbi:DUF421 domain-containing protein [Sphingobacterium sp. BS-2]|uniref:DUF421 domain-containing protein n=1 Tax=Sphingobacterium sp. BS-2 TaxID=3377129 RepID=UPI0038FC1B61
MELIENIFAGDLEGGFLLEIFLRTIVMFLLVLIVLRLSGRRGVRQLTLFEMAIIISLGSAAGDPMFQEDLPIFYAIVVFICVILVYKLIIWLAYRSEKLTHLLEGKVLPVVKNGEFDIKHEKDNNFSQMEFFSELRNLNIEHLGQVKEAVLEIDGTLSVLFYPEDQVRYGLPLFPSLFKSVDVSKGQGPFACMYCGHVVSDFANDSESCQRCKNKQWSKAINTKRV